MSYGDYRLHAEELGVTRGGRLVAEGVDFSVGPGDWLELRGPNGGGKTSLLRCLAGLSRPEYGQIRWTEGGTTENGPPRGRFAWLGHSDGLQNGFTVREMLNFWAAAGAGGAAADCAGALGLTRFLDAPARKLSAGWRRRAAFARLLLLGRPLWLLDEPFSNLDAEGVEIALTLMRDHRARGGAVIAAMHGPSPDMAGGRVLTLLAAGEAA